VIEDLEGAPSEPTRRWHVLVLSAATAAVSLVLLVALVVPPSITSSAPQAPAASASPGPVMMIVSGPTMFFQSGPLPGMRVDQSRVSECAEGSLWDPPHYLVLDRNGQVIAAYSSERNWLSDPITPDAYVGTGWLTVPCDTRDVFAPRMNRAR